jgi:hypothetical protein
MSRSPQKNLRRSLESLTEALDACERYAEAREDLVRAVGEDGYAELQRLRASLAALADQAQKGRD